MTENKESGCVCNTAQESGCAGFPHKGRVEMPRLDLSLRVSSFDEVEQGLTEEAAVAEALRCLGCNVGLCVGCSICAEICPDACISIETEKTSSGKTYVTSYSIDSCNCMFCGLCQEACPTGTLSHTAEYEHSVYHKSQMKYEMNIPGETERKQH